MAYYLVTYKKENYTNLELCRDVIAGGERAFYKMLTQGRITGRTFFGQTLYLLTDDLRDKVRGAAFEEQDFDAAVAAFRKVEITELGHGDHRVITVRADFVDEIYCYNRIEFIRMKDWKEPNKYRVQDKLATVKLCGFRYVALDTVNTAAENPIIVTLKR
jgi:hypothetical protein